MMSLTQSRARHLRRLVAVVFVAGIAALIWPQSLGGPVAYLSVTGNSMEPHIEDEDLAVVRRGGSYDVGDVVAYRIPNGEVGEGAIVIHRVVRVENDGSLVTRGDNRDVDDRWRPKSDDVIGREWFHLPSAGSIMASMRAPLPLAVVATLLVLWIAAGTGKRRGDDETDVAESDLVVDLTERPAPTDEPVQVGAGGSNR